MSEYVHLLGAEQVQSAASSMRSSAELIQRSVENLSYALELHHRQMEELLQRFEAAVERMGQRREADDKTGEF